MKYCGLEATNLIVWSFHEKYNHLAHETARHQGFVLHQPAPTTIQLFTIYLSIYDLFIRNVETNTRFFA